MSKKEDGPKSAGKSKGKVEAVKSEGSSATRVLGLLNLFTPETPTWTVDMFQEQLQLARATAYRYARELHNAGFLVPAAGGGYVLGPRFIEFDRQIRLGDPLMRVGPAIMETQRELVNGAQLLCAFYGDRVLTIHQDRTDDTIAMSMERGRPFPLFRGAPSRAILAHLAPYHLRNMFLSHSQTIAAEGLGENWPEFRDRMKAIRKRGYYVGSEIDHTLVGVAAPIFRTPDSVTGCLCFVRLKDQADAADIEKLGKGVVIAAKLISEALQADEGSSPYPTTRSPR